MQEIALQRADGAGRHILAEKDPAEFFTRAQDLPATVPAPPVVASGQVEKLEGPCQRTVKSVGSLRSPRRDRAIDLTPHIGELHSE